MRVQILQVQLIDNIFYELIIQDGFENKFISTKLSLNLCLVKFNGTSLRNYDKS